MQNIYSRCFSFISTADNLSGTEHRDNHSTSSAERSQQVQFPIAAARGRCKFTAELQFPAAWSWFISLAAGGGGTEEEGGRGAAPLKHNSLQQQERRCDWSVLWNVRTLFRRYLAKATYRWNDKFYFFPLRCMIWFTIKIMHPTVKLSLALNWHQVFCGGLFLCFITCS